MAKKKGTNTVTLGILLLLVIGLAGFGVTNFGGSVRSVATVGSAEVGVNEYVRTVEAQIRQFEGQTGQRLTFQQAQGIGLDRAALGQLIAEAALENEAAGLGLSVGDEKVVEEIRNAPAFQDSSGGFDRQVYELSLSQNGVDVDAFEARVRSDIAKGLLRRAVAAGIETPEVYTDTLYAYALETRDVTWARLTADDLLEPVTEPTDEDLAAYHEANADTFTRPETKVISYAWLSPDMLVDDIDIGEDQIRTLYDERLDEYVQPERRLVERLVFATEAQAAEAKARLDAGEIGFDDLVAERGLELSDVDLGDVSLADLGDASEAVFAMTEPGVVGPLDSDVGPALFRMNGILAAQEITFDEVREELKTEAAADRARRIILDTVPRIEDLLAGGADVSVLAERTDMQQGTIEWNADVFDGIAAYDAFRSAAAVAQPGAFGEVIEFDDGSIATLSVDEIRPPALRPLAEVRDEVAEAWTAAKTREALESEAGNMAEQIRKGREMAGLDLDLETDRALGRDAVVDGTPPDFVETVFQLMPDEIAVLSADDDAWLVRLDSINVPDPSTAEAQAAKAAFSAQTANEFAAAISTAYARALVDQAGVELNQSGMNSINAQLQ